MTSAVVTMTSAVFGNKDLLERACAGLLMVSHSNY